MSKQDTHFFNVFSMVIALLVVVTVALFALARIVASHTQKVQVLNEADYSKNVAVRIEPPTQEAVAGKDNSALAIKVASGGEAGSAAPTRPYHPPWVHRRCPGRDRRCRSAQRAPAHPSACRRPPQSQPRPAGLRP